MQVYVTGVKYASTPLTIVFFFFNLILLNYKLKTFDSGVQFDDNFSIAVHFVKRHYIVNQFLVTAVPNCPFCLATGPYTRMAFKSPG